MTRIWLLLSVLNVPSVQLRRTVFIITQLDGIQITLAKKQKAIIFSPAVHSCSQTEVSYGRNEIYLFWAAKDRNKSLHFTPWKPLSQPRPKLPPGPALPGQPQELLFPAFPKILQVPAFPQFPIPQASYRSQQINLHTSFKPIVFFLCSKSSWS